MIPLVWLLLVGLAGAVPLSLCATPAAGQPFWIPRDGKNAVMLELYHPSVEGIDQSTLSSVSFLSARLGLSPTLNVVGELPYSHFKATFEDFFTGTTIEESASTIGNPYLGIECLLSGSPVFFELGLRAPATDENKDNAWGLGILADATRWESFIPNAVSAQAAFNLREVTPSHMEYRLRFSPVVLIPTGSSNGDVELFGNYAWAIGYHGRVVRIGTGLSGRALFTEDSGNVGARTVNQFELHSDFGSWSVRPGFELRVPLGSLANDVPAVVGASLSWNG
jgi:hypothetical protein